jgi:hypothetical protein
MQHNSNNRTLRDHVDNLTGNNRTATSSLNRAANSPTDSRTSAGSYPTTSLPGPAPNTAGPHNKDILNKLDPTVDALSGGTQVLGPGINAEPGNRMSHPQDASRHTGQHTGQHTGHHVPGSGPASVEREEYGTQRRLGQTHAQYEPQHNSRMANKLDPRVDSTDTSPNTGPNMAANTHDHRGMGHTTGRPMGENTYARENEFAGREPYGQGAVGGGSNNPYESQNTPGPHNSRIANVLDPRVNESNTMQEPSGPGHTAAVGHGTGRHANETGYRAEPGYGAEAGHGVGNVYQEGHGMHRQENVNLPGGGNGAHRQENVHDNGGLSRKPVHSSGLANQLDPRVDSRLQEGDYTTNRPTEGHVAYGHENAAPRHHGGNFADAAPGRGQFGDASYEGRMRGGAHDQSTTVHHGPEILPGPASKTAGPHKSNLLNKLDPRVDSKAAVTQQREYRTS